jgi:hypothetical protein
MQPSVNVALVWSGSGDKCRDLSCGHQSAFAGSGHLFKAAAVAKKQGQLASLAEAIPLVGQETYDAYRQKARDVPRSSRTPRALPSKMRRSSRLSREGTT